MWPTMSAFKSDFLNILKKRGFIHQMTDEAGLDTLAAKGSLTAYNGFDLTAESLHVGSLFPIMMLRWLQKTGHKPIVLLGGGTTRVGDPTGKDESRKLLSQEQIQANKAGIRKVFDRFLDFGDGPTDALIVDNDEWLSNLGYIAFLRDYGRHFTVNRMLTFDSVKLRLEREQPMSFIEFNYMLLQAYDFVELHRRYGCVLQTGGSDQWGNIVNGVELGRRCEGVELFGLTSPLLTTASGAKMGKTASGAVWLNPDMLAPYDYWQFWRNTEDADVGRMLRVFTELPLEEIARLEALQGGEINEAKKVLATEATALLHGREAADAAAETARQNFEHGGDAADAAAETARKTFEHGAAAEGLPTVSFPASKLDAGIGVLAAFVHAGLAASNGEVRRHIQGGGVRINNQPVLNDRCMLTKADLRDGQIKLSLGKKKHALLRPE
jgi:tyrosyl-tRNA synthetase